MMRSSSVSSGYSNLWRERRFSTTAENCVVPPPWVKRMECVGGTSNWVLMRDSTLERNATNSLERCEITAIPMPVLLKLSSPSAAFSSTDWGRAEGPGPKLITREVGIVVRDRDDDCEFECECDCGCECECERFGQC